MYEMYNTGLPPPPTLQPGHEWNSMIKAACKEAELIIDLAVGYADFLAEAVERGCRILHCTPKAVFF